MSQESNVAKRAMEQKVASALAQGHYKSTKRKFVGNRFGLRAYYINRFAEDGQGRIHLISLKWQGGPGSTEGKVPFEVISLIDVLRRDKGYYTAHLVLGGDGWSYRDFFVDGGLLPFIPDADRIHIVTLEDFVSAASQGRL